MNEEDVFLLHPIGFKRYISTGIHQASKGKIFYSMLLLTGDHADHALDSWQFSYLEDLEANKNALIQALEGEGFKKVENG